MSRYFHESGDFPLRPESMWLVFEAVDTYLRSQVDGPVHLKASDARGSVTSGSFNDFKQECQDHGEAVTYVWMTYGTPGESDIWFQVTSGEIDRPRGDRYGPSVQIAARGLDPARVRGVVAEAVDRAKHAQREVELVSDDSDNVAVAIAEPVPARRYSSRERRDIAPDRAWVVLELADAVATQSLDGKFKRLVGVTDQRGQFETATVREAREQWVTDSLPLESIRVIYLNTETTAPEPLIYVDGLQNRPGSAFGPNLNVSVTSESFADAERLAKSIVAAAGPEKEEAIASADSTEATLGDRRDEQPSAASVAPSMRAAPVVPPGALWKRVLSSQYSVQIIGGSIAGLIVAIVIAIWVFFV